MGKKYNIFKECFQARAMSNAIKAEKIPRVLLLIRVPFNKLLFITIMFPMLVQHQMSTNKKSIKTLFVYK